MEFALGGSYSGHKHTNVNLVVSAGFNRLVNARAALLVTGLQGLSLPDAVAYSLSLMP